MTLPLILVVLTMPVFRAVPVEEPNITLLAREDDDTVKLLCLLEDYYPETYTNIMWLKDKTPFSGSPVTRTIINNSKRRYFQISEIHFDAQQLNKSTEYTCQARHNPEIIKSTWSNYKDKFSLKINPPSEKDLFVQNKAVITCVITGDNKNEVEAANVSWTFGGQPASAGSTVTDNVKETTAPFTKTSNLTLSESEWFSGKEVKCSTERDKTPFSETIKVKKGGERPSVLFYRPEKHVSDTDKVSLLCEVSSSDLGDVYIMWQKNIDPYMKSSSTVRINDNTVLSYLTVSGREYNNKNNRFTCAAKNANKENDTYPRTSTTSKSKLADCPPCPAD